MTRLARLNEYQNKNGVGFPGIKFRTYYDYIKEGGSDDYIEYLCISMNTPRPGYVFSLQLVKGTWFWKRFYKIWIYMRDPWTSEFYGTKEEAMNQQTLREELVRSRYWIQRLAPGKNL